ncbi:MAG TPA: TolC family protein [Saprospiraceae bacterium]|nr:TolC family protein [Saprospiraceae bacterium]HND87740.1 TolC family protein [Saprospiraceae bacterium]HNG88869.1 TolC family protein [Saprospiraceae bacterium]
MKHHQVIFLAIALSLWAAGASAQSAILEQYIQQGLSANASLRQQDLEVKKAQEMLRQSRSIALPKLDFEANYTLATGGRTLDFPIGDLLDPLYLKTFGIPSPVGNQNIQFLPNNFHETKVNVAYPLFNSDIRYNRQIQQSLLEGKMAQQAAGAHELRYQITEAYLRYLQAIEAERLWANARDVLLELRRFNESLVKNNVATRDVVATADYELSRTDQEIIRLRSQQNTARAYFNYLINQDLQQDVQVDSLLLRSAGGSYQPDALLSQALARRPEFAALRAGQQAADTDVRRNAANLRLPDLYIGGSFGFQGFKYTFSKEQAFSIGQVGLTYDLFDGGLRSSRTEVARLEAEKLRQQTVQVQQQIALQITSAWNDLQSAQQGYRTAQTGVRAAEEIFRIVNNKYRANQVLLLEFMDAQNRLTNARLQQLLAWADVLLKEAALKKAAGE